MKINIKKIYLILALILSSTFCFGAETLTLNLGSDYLIATDNPIKANSVENPSILTINPFFTIFNEKNIMLLHPEKLGKTLLTFFLDNGDISFNVTVKAKNTPCVFKPIKKNGFEVTLLDQPPELDNFEFDAPPIDMEGN